MHIQNIHYSSTNNSTHQQSLSSLPFSHPQLLPHNNQSTHQIQPPNQVINHIFNLITLPQSRVSLALEYSPSVDSNHLHTCHSLTHSLTSITTLSKLSPRTTPCLSSCNLQFGIYGTNWLFVYWLPGNSMYNRNSIFILQRVDTAQNGQKITLFQYSPNPPRNSQVH